MSPATRFGLCAIVLAVAFAAQASAQVGHDKIVSCYWGAWSFYRPGYGKFDVDDIDASLCTHGFYGFSDLDNQTWTIYSFDPWYDLDSTDCDHPENCFYNSYRRFVSLRNAQNPNFVPMLSIGGWNAGSGKYSLMAADPSKRKTFIDSVIPFVNKYGFHGVDLDWEYPGSREGADAEHDKANFNVLVREMAEALHADGKLFTAALSPGKKTIDIAYDIPEIVKHFDFINVMCYDYHGWWNNHTFTGVNSPLYGREEERYEDHPGWYFNVFDTMSYYLSKGAPKEKLVMGMPAYGRGFKLVEPTENGLYCEADAGIPMGPYTKQDGIWGFQEILQAFNNDTLINLPDGKPKDWTVVTDDCYKAPYAYNGPYWIGYDTPESIAVKAKFINFLGIAGAMLWSVDTDDFRGDYHSKTYPILRAVHDVLATGDTLDPESPMCTGTAPMCDLFDRTTTEVPTTTTTIYDGQCTENNENLPYPGDCHQYYQCRSDGQGGFTLVKMTCGDWAFDPNFHSCVNPCLPANEHLCNAPPPGLNCTATSY